MILSKSNLCKYSNIWIDFINLEKQFGDEKHQRKLLNRALKEVIFDEKAIIYEEFLSFERLNGNISNFKDVYYKYESY